MSSFSKSKRLMLPLLVLLIAGLVVPAVLAQETTGGLQGTVKDPSGAVVSGATVGVTSAALIGTKTVTTDAGGYFRFANLPPGTYTITVTAPNFRSYKQENIDLAVGHLPSIDMTLQVGTASETVEVSGTAPIVDVTQSKVQTNVTEDVLQNVPKGRSFQSVIQFAPGARSEPLQGGYQIDGASNSENSYLVEGQETGSVLYGNSAANIPMEFIQEVQIKSSGFEAEYGGALGGVVNVVQKRGSNQWHGSVFTYYQGDAFDAGPSRQARRDPTIGANAGGAIRLDSPLQYIQPKKDHYRIWEPGVEVGGYLFKDRLWVFASTVPRFFRNERTVLMSNLYPVAAAASGVKTPGLRTFATNTDTYYSLARVDFLATQKIRLFGSWNYSYAKNRGLNAPAADDVFGKLNITAGDNPDNYNNGVGYVAPNVIYNVGADITITPNLVATARFGYFYQNYESRGQPQGIRYYYRDTTYSYSTTAAPGLTSSKALCILASCGGAGQTLGVVAPGMVNSTGFSNIGDNTNTFYDKTARTSFGGDLAYFKKAFGTHNLKFGYAMNRLSNNVLTVYNAADVYVAFANTWSPSLTSPSTSGGRFGPGNHCADVMAENLTLFGVAGSCKGNWGTVNLRDLGTGPSKVASFNHALYVQDAWTMGHGLTINAGVRFDKETLPSYTAGFNGINFGLGDKIAPRLGASWDVMENGKFKVYGSFGYFYDIMKFNMPRGSFGGDWWHDCVYTFDGVQAVPGGPWIPNFNTQFVPARGADGHYCPGTGGASGTVTGGRFIANEDFRAPSNDPRAAIDPYTGLPRSGVDPKLKPMKQHEYVAGADWAVTPTLAFESRYSRKRLDRTIEDAGVITPFGEQYYIVNPGFGDHAVSCTGCPPNPKANRSYDGLEFALNRRSSGKWFGKVSYTYSRLYGNYSGLTATDISDGGGARDGANVDRAFDEPFMSFDAHGKVINGPLGTDRPHTFKAFGYYRLKWWKMETMLGGYQQWYSGTPLTSYISVWGAPVFVEGRGNIVDITRNPVTGDLVAGTVKGARTPSFSQTDFSLIQEMHVSKTNERLVLGFEANITNLFNQKSVTLIDTNMYRTGSTFPACGAVDCPDVKLLETGGYNYITASNADSRILNSRYMQPYGYQGGRNMRFKIRFSF
jgi:Carboxypeptidase regulatory-like domain/TonB-dependent Receptor Plug Domain